MTFDIVQLCDINIDVIDGDRGKNYPHQDELLEAGHCLFLSAKNVTQNGFLFADNQFITQEKDELLNNGKLMRGDIVITTRGTVGNVAIYSDEVPYDNIRINSGMLIIRCGDKIDNYYLYQVLRSKWFYNQILSIQSGSAQPQLPKSHFLKMTIPMPNMNTQHKIAGVLSSIGNKISVNTAINENLEQQAQALFKAWFVDFEPFGGVMPDDWSECILDSMCSLIIKGITPKYNEHSAQLVINQKCVRNHQIDLSLARCHEPKKVNEKWLQYGDIVVNSTGTGTLGRAAQVLFTPNNMTVDSHVTIIRASKQEYIYYLGLWATSHEHDFEMLQTGSTGQTDLPRERLKQMQIVLPSDSILSSFSKVIKPIADIRIQKQQENQRLSALRDTLLPKLMNGEIDVSAVKI